MSAIQDATEGPWLSSFAEARSRARQERRPLLVDFWDPACLGCMKMLAETFPDERVDELLRAEFVCLKLNTHELPEDARPLVRAQRLIWTPDLLFLDPAGAQLSRRLGFHPPAEFEAVLRLTLGQSAMAYRDHAAAERHFGAASEVPGAAVTRTEALFWLGIAAYKLDGRGDRAVLRAHWEELRDHYPHSEWWVRAEASWGAEAPLELAAG